ncbi:hypothetical protein [Streptomyces sp. WMMB 322]|uniref:hypothetical protein n=1 Tax=Streptomyces sp. WMMB 322 TaxID=1286821 RepID=UPI0011130321|nr:hypothetical protein [Streptomyces sp. WMMB 322]
MLREAAVVAAVVGGVGMVGSGVAAAGGWEPPQLPNVTCTQANGDTVTNGDVDLPALVTLTGGAGDADARNQQNNCGIGIIGNDQTSGDATGGTANGLA